MKFMEWLTLNIMILTVIGEGRELVSTSVIPLHSTIGTLLAHWHVKRHE